MIRPTGLGRVAWYLLPGREAWLYLLKSSGRCFVHDVGCLYELRFGYHCLGCWSVHCAAGEFMACLLPAVCLNCCRTLCPIKINLASSASFGVCCSSCSSASLPADLKWFWQLSPCSGRCHWSCKSWVWVSRLILYARVQQTLYTAVVQFNPSRDSSELSSMRVGSTSKYI